MTKEAVFTLKLEPELRDNFRAAARASHRPASQLMRELMREFVDRHQRQAREQEEASSQRLILKADLMPLGSMPRTNEEIEAEFAARRARAAASKH